MSGAGRLALATCRVLPEPDPEQAPLLAALEAAGVEAVAAAWDDPEVDWGGFASVVLRSTWNYHRQAEAFLAWIEGVAGRTALWNPAEVVRWNAHKGYLLDLERRGFPVTPTALLRRGAAADLPALAAARGWEDLVIKPAVSAGSHATVKVGPADYAAGQAHLERLLAHEDALVQPYLPGVEEPGERCLVWIDGALTHAVRKRPRFQHGHEQVTKVEIAGDEARLAEALLAEVAPGALYGRVDLTRGPDGAPRLMELELIEPSLFTHLHPPARARLVAALSRTAGRG